MELEGQRRAEELPGRHRDRDRADRWDFKRRDLYWGDVGAVRRQACLQNEDYVLDDAGPPYHVVSDDQPSSTEGKRLSLAQTLRTSGFEYMNSIPYAVSIVRLAKN